MCVVLLFAARCLLIAVVCCLALVVVCCALGAVRCVLSIACYSLFVRFVRCLVCGDCWLLFAVRCSLLVLWLLFVVCWLSLRVDGCSLCVGCCASVCDARCVLFVVC